MSDDVFRLVEPEGFESLVDDLAEYDGNDNVVVGTLSEATREYDPEDDLLRVADFVYPGEIVDDPTDALDDANDALVTSGFTAEEYLDASADVVFSPSEYKRVAREVASEYDDPVFVVGIWSPGRDYRMTGNAENGKPRRLSRMAYPERAFDTAKGCEPLQKMSLTIQGTVVVERSQLSTEAIEFVAGERDELEIADRNPDMLEPVEVQDLVGRLSPGDEVQINDRARPLEVVPPGESEMIGTTADVNVFLEARGNHYRIAFDSSESARPRLVWASDSEYITELEVVSSTEASPEMETGNA